MASRAAVWVIVIGVALASTPSDVRAQTASLQGILLDESTAQPVQGVDVVLEQDGVTVRSEVSGRAGLFQMTGLAAGVYQLRFIMLGRALREETIDLADGEVRTANRRLPIGAVQLEGIGVAGEGTGAVRRELGGQTILAGELARVPTPAASGDLASYLKTQPGVVASGDRGGQLFIRGGTPTENLALMDGMLLYQPFHITGLFSAFPEHLIQSAEFFAGGFGPRYSGRMSSVLDVQMRDGDRNRTAVTASASPFLAEATVEGPIGSDADSYIVSLRRSLIRETSPRLLGEEQPLGFESQYFRLSHLNPSGSSRCSATVLRSRDEGGLDPEDRDSRVGWTNLLTGGRCMTLSGETFIDVKFGRSGVSSEAITRGASEFTASARRIFIDADVSRTFGRVRANWGGYVHSEAVSYDLQELLAERSVDEERWGATGLYGELELPVTDRVRVLPGAVVSLAAKRRVSLEPRVRASWQVTGLDGELSGAVGLYGQRLSGISDRRDASSIFTAWVRTPPDTRMRTIHAQASWEQSLGTAFSWSVDAWYRRMEELPVATWSAVARFTPEISQARGRSRGGDARAEYRRGPLHLFGAYALSWTEYHTEQEDFGVWFGEPVQAYHPPHDRRHQASALASIAVGPGIIAAHWEYGSGFPYTRPIGFDEVIDFRTDSTALPPVWQTFGQTRLLLERPYNGRLPSAHRLDISARLPVHAGSVEMEVQGGAINLYSRNNLFYYDVFAGRRIDQLPFTPWVSVQLRYPAPGRS